MRIMSYSCLGYRCSYGRNGYVELEKTQVDQCTKCAVPFVEEGIPLFIYPLKEMMRGGINGKVNRIFIRYDFFLKERKFLFRQCRFNEHLV